nr:hypothetical protein CFP56_22722 [Quercus suber]
MVFFKDFSSFNKKYLVVTKESNDAKEVDISMLVERPIIGRFAERWPELKDSRDIVEWTYDVSQNSGSPSGAWSLRSSLHKNTTETHYEIDVPGPKIVVYSEEGGAKHFDEHEARKLIHGTSMQWDANLYVKNREETFLDDGGLFRNSLTYFMSIRSSYLSMRQDGHLIVEPYSPFRFSRQLGLCQDIPGTIKEDICQGTLDKIVEFWRLCILYKTGCKAFFPVPPTLSNSILHTTSGYKKWWNHIHGKYLDDGVNILVASAHPPPPKSKVVQPINVKSDNNKDIQLPKVHVPNTFSKSVNHPIQSKESQGVTTKLKKPPSKAPYIERSLEVQDAFDGGANPVLEEMSDDNDSDHHWVRTKKPKLTIPSNPNSLRGITSASENLKGAKDQSDQQTLPLDIDNDVASNDSESSISGPQSSTALPRNIGEVANTDSRKNVTRSPQRTKSYTPKVFEYNPNDEILKCRIDLAFNLWKSLQQKIVRTPFNKTYLLLDGANKIFEAITTNQAIDPSTLETLVAEYFDKANTFTSLQSSFSSCMTLEQHDKKLTEYKVQLDD